MYWDNFTKLIARLRHVFHLMTFFLLVSHSVLAIEQGGSVKIKVYGDHILIPVTFKTAGLTKQTHIILDYGNHEAFGLHENVYNSLGPRLGKNETTLKVNFESFGIEVPVKDITSKSAGSTSMDRLTARYDVELQNIDIAAIIGYPILKKYSIKLNLNKNEIQFTPSSIDHASKAQQRADVYISDLSVFQNNVYVPISANGKPIGTMELNTVGYHTVIDPEVGNKFNIIKDIKLGNTDAYAMLSEMVAIRKQTLPEAVVVTQPPQKQGEKPKVIYQQEFPKVRVMKAGLSLWRGYEVEFDPQIGFIALTRVVDNQYSDADAAFYEASYKKSWNKLKAFIDAFPYDRNVEEAVAEMAEVGLATNVSHDDFIQVIDQGAEIQKTRAKASYYFGFAWLANQAKFNKKHNEIVISLGKKALEYVSRAQSPKDREPLQRMLGDAYLNKNDAHTAWKYFLSASFNGDPDQEVLTRMGLAKTYAVLKRYRRAYSNYQRVARLIPAQFHEEVGLTKAMADVRKHLKPNDPLLEKNND
ncbi:hypothetical protein D5018_09950 [Parashewanella curva]|uniref:Tetratricopeptide repeat protein n=1 Tax=Parashewanella curva TaxID=2338552 RepID=A0A3L8PZ66_9GAMM|nr:hypothetical protein [Parashewanella curva]RLV59883.1 hypothetical protein D5018_09950 [Parashewanella curva]